MTDTKTEVHDNRFLIVGGNWVTGLLFFLLFMWMLVVVIGYIYYVALKVCWWIFQEAWATCILVKKVVFHR